MFKSKITVSVLLAGVMISSLFMFVIGYVQGNEAWIVWAYTTLISIVAVSTTVIWLVIRGK